MKDDAGRFIAYPLYIRPPSLLERAMLRLNFGGIARCTICGSITPIVGVEGNLRESCRASAAARATGSDSSPTWSAGGGASCGACASPR